MNTGQAISGAVLLVLGVVLLVVAVVNGFRGGSIISLIYSIPSIILGLVILLNRNEDYIEPIRGKLKGGKNE